MNNREYYAVKIIFQQKEFYSIWITADDGDYFFQADNQIEIFLTKTELQSFCEKHKIKIESESLYDFDSINYEDCNLFINFWNLIADLAKTLGVSFVGDKDEYLNIYKKLLCGCNLPTMNRDLRKFVPNFSDEEIKELKLVVSDMKNILESVYSKD